MCMGLHDLWKLTKAPLKSYTRAVVDPASCQPGNQLTWIISNHRFYSLQYWFDIKHELGERYLYPKSTRGMKWDKNFSIKLPPADDWQIDIYQAFTRTLENVIALVSFTDNHPFDINIPRDLYHESHDNEHQVVQVLSSNVFKHHIHQRVNDAITQEDLVQFKKHLVLILQHSLYKQKELPEHTYLQDIVAKIDSDIISLKGMLQQVEAEIISEVEQEEIVISKEGTIDINELELEEAMSSQNITLSLGKR